MGCIERQEKLTACHFMVSGVADLDLTKKD
jgi:hypothetical protein